MQYTTTRDYVRHECGHIVVGKVLGFDTAGIIVKERSAGATSEQYFSCPTMNAVSNHLMRRIQVLFAGAIAQTLSGTKIDASEINNLLDGPAPFNTAAHDFAKLKELMRLWVAIRYPNATNEEFTKKLAKANRVLANSAAKIVVKEAPVVHAMTAAAMAAYISFSRVHKNKEFEFTKAQVDAVPEVRQRFP